MSRYLPSNSDYDLQQSKTLRHTRKRIFRILKHNGIERSDKSLNENARLLYGLISNNQEARLVTNKILKRIFPEGIPIPIAASQYDVYPQSNLLASCIYTLLPEQLKEQVYTYSDYPPRWVSVNTSDSRNDISVVVFSELLTMLDEVPIFKPSQTSRIEQLEKRLDYVESIIQRLDPGNGNGNLDTNGKTRRSVSNRRTEAKKDKNLDL